MGVGEGGIGRSETKKSRDERRWGAGTGLDKFVSFHGLKRVDVFSFSFPFVIVEVYEFGRFCISWSQRRRSRRLGKKSGGDAKRERWSRSGRHLAETKLVKDEFWLGDRRRKKESADEGVQRKEADCCHQDSSRGREKKTECR